MVMSDELTSQEKANLVERICGPVAERDREIVEHWRSASPAEHAKAMIELAHYAEMMVAQTGFGKDPDEMFPGFPPLRGNAEG
jgi:hypothetical protein